MRCDKCGRKLDAHRGCREVSLRCPSCGKVFDLGKYAGKMDQAFEEEMAFVPMDRI